MGDKNEMWLEPRGIFLNSDPNMMNKIDKSFLYPTERFSGDSKASAMNRALRKFEWKSFSASEIKS